MVLVSPKKYKLNCVVRFSFKASNNVAYEVLIAGLKLSKEMKVKKLVVNSNLQLVVSQ